MDTPFILLLRIAKMVFVGSVRDIRKLYNIRRFAGMSLARVRSGRYRDAERLISFFILKV